VKTVYLLLLVAATLSFAAEEFAPDTSLCYKSIDSTKLFLHVFYPPKHECTGKIPAIVFFFGGGWVTGSPSQFYPHCRYLASRGMVAFSAEYRIWSKHQASPSVCVEDAKSAIRWIRLHAEELGIDPGHLAAGGGSAGGHLAAAAATLKAFDNKGENNKISCKPDALVLFNPVLDNGPGGFGYNRVKEYWKKFSPLHNIPKHMPPTILFLGSEDKLVPVSTAEKFKTLMEKKGGRCDVRLYQGQGHGFFNYNHLEYYQKTAVEMDRFLASLGYLNGEPVLEMGN